MLVDEQNKKGGLLGKKLEAVVVDPASNWPLFAEKARELLAKDKVDVVFGCWTSVSRKSRAAGVRGTERPAVLPGAVRGRGIVQERLLHRRRAQPAGDPGGGLPDEGHGREALGAGRHRLRLPAHHQQDPGGLPEVQGRQGRGHHDQLHAVRAFGLAVHRRATSRSSAPPARRPPWCPPSTATPTCRSTRSWATRASRPRTSRWWPSRWARKSCPASTPSPLVGHLAAWNYFMSVDTPRERGLHQGLARLHQEPQARDQRPDGGARDRLRHVGEGGREGRHHRCRTRSATPSSASRCPNMTGGTAKMLPNHHLTKPVLIGEIQADGQFETVWQTDGLVPGDAWSDFLPGSARTSRPTGSPSSAATTTPSPRSAPARTTSDVADPGRPGRPGFPCDPVPSGEALEPDPTLAGRPGGAGPDALRAGGAARSPNRLPIRPPAAGCRRAPCRRSPRPDSCAKPALLQQIADSGEPWARAVLQGLLDGTLQIRKADQRVVLARAGGDGFELIDPVSGAALGAGERRT